MPSLVCFSEIIGELLLSEYSSVDLMSIKPTFIDMRDAEVGDGQGIVESS